MGLKRDSRVDYYLTEDGLVLIAAWARDGLTMQQMADRIGTDSTTLSRWKKGYPEIKEAMSRGKELVDYMVENALLKAALGYETKEIKVTLGKKVVNGETYAVMKETTTKQVGPNPVACLAWLNNRKHEQWKRNRDNCETISPDDSNVTVKIIRGKDSGTADEQGDVLNDGVEIRIKPDSDRKPKKVLEDGTVEGTRDMDYWPDDFEEEQV